MMVAPLPPMQRSSAITVGVDTHKDLHHVVVLNELGVRLARKAFATKRSDYAQLHRWLLDFGNISNVGIESTGTYGAGLARYLLGAGVHVVEVNTPHRHTRARVGKSDAIDAEAAARKVLSGEATTVVKDTTGPIESIRVLRVARDSAVKSRSAALTQLQDLLVTAPGELRESITAVSGPGKATQAARLHPNMRELSDPLQAVKLALRSLARRIADLDLEIKGLDDTLDGLVAATGPSLVSKVGIGTGNAGQLLVTAGQNITRLTSEAAFARLCGVAPIPVSSGKTDRMRLHRGGDRQANRALYMITVCRLRYHPRTIAYVQRRISEGKTKSEAIRCVKRFIAREVFRALRADLIVPSQSARSSDSGQQCSG